MVEEHIGVILVVKEQHPVSSGTEFPDVFLQVFGDVLTKPCAVVLKQLDVLGNLFMLYPCVFV